VVLVGRGCEGAGEDVTYSDELQQSCPAAISAIAEQLTGEWTLDSFSQHLDELDIFTDGTPPPGMEHYRRWAIESAALDLALAQAGTNLFDVYHAPVRPVRFCLSMDLGKPASTERVHAWLRARPGTEFKIDLGRSWDASTVADLKATGAVDVIDIKAHYKGDWIDNTPDPELYRLVAEQLPHALIEDAMLNDDTRESLSAASDRLTWDAIIHSLDDVLTLELPPAAINIKPSRFGTVRSLLETIDHCVCNDIPMYGGGQYELGRGRTHLQVLASIWYAGHANDVAPVVFHTAAPGDDVPSSPLELPAQGPGFGFNV
jgi:hypothetical protein